MEENLIDSSKYKISLVSLDTRFASSRSAGNGEFKVNLPRKMRDVMRIRMASAEIPLVAYTFSLEAGNTTFAVKLGTNTTFVKCTPIPSGNYSISKLTQAIEVSLQNVHSGFSVSFNTVTGRLTILNSSIYFEMYLASYDTRIAARPANWGIGYNLGFRKSKVNAEQQPSGGYFIQGSTVLSLQAAPYYLLQLSCPDPVENVTHPVLDDCYLTAFAKVILNDNAYTYQFDNNSNLLRKEYTYLAPYSIPYFSVRLMDGWGDTINMKDIDWSITIEVTEVVNSKTFATISKTYSRP